MFYLNWRLAVLAAVILVVWAWPTAIVGRRMRDLQRRWQEDAADLSVHVEETFSVSGSMLVRSFGREEFESARFDTLNDSLRTLATRRLMMARWFNMTTQLFGTASIGVVYWVGSNGVAAGDVTVGSVVAFAVLTQRMFGPFAIVARVNTTMLASLAVFERVFEYFDLPESVTEPDDPVKLEHPRGRVDFEHITFSYEGADEPALADFNWSIEPGSMVAVVGPSGAGKTTAAYLLQRFFDPDQGSVCIDGVDIRRLSLSSVSDNVGVVMQETSLFHASLADNILYGDLSATRDEVFAAAKIAGLGALISRLPEGIDTVVGERGFRLSGGERQRVAIARAVLKDPPIMILDEATSSLDSRTEAEIREATKVVASGRTTVVIAHRLSTVLDADEIIVLDHGRVRERGRHHDLIELGGLYAELYAEQFATAQLPAGQG